MRPTRKAKGFRKQFYHGRSNPPAFLFRSRQKAAASIHASSQYRSTNCHNRYNQSHELSRGERFIRSHTDIYESPYRLPIADFHAIKSTYLRDPNTRFSFISQSISSMLYLRRISATSLTMTPPSSTLTDPGATVINMTFWRSGTPSRSTPRKSIAAQSMPSSLDITSARRGSLWLHRSLIGWRPNPLNVFGVMGFEEG